METPRMRGGLKEEGLVVAVRRAAGGRGEAAGGEAAGRRGAVRDGTGGGGAGEGCGEVTGGRGSLMGGG